MVVNLTVLGFALPGAPIFPGVPLFLEPVPNFLSKNAGFLQVE